MNQDKIKHAFLRAKQDIFLLKNEINQLRLELNELKQLIKSQIPQDNSRNSPYIYQKPASTSNFNTQTYPVTSTDTSTVPQEIEGLRSPNLSSSTGNRGASTDRQTDTSTDNYTEKGPFSTNFNSIESNIQEASEILDSLDRLKKEIRHKFKRVTAQEMVVFSTIYQLEDQNTSEITYKLLASYLKLSESSIRDYVQRMINKGIPIKKYKINNRKIVLSISSELKKIATLSTIIQLREL